MNPTSRVPLVLLSGLAALLAMVPGPATVGGAARAAAASLTAPDFNGDGVGDLAVGAPGEDLGTGPSTEDDAGAVNLFYGTPSGLYANGAVLITDRRPSGLSGEDPTLPDDRFGSALATGDFDADGFSDLAVGVPGEEVGISGGGEVVDAGAVTVFYGTEFGIAPAGTLIGSSSAEIIDQDTADVAGSAETGDAFGSALTSGDFNDDGFADLAVGVPNEDVGVIEDAGAVAVIYGSASGLDPAGTTDDQLWQQGPGSEEVDLPEADDGYGRTLAAGDFGNGSADDLAVGVTGEDVDGSTSAGAVDVVYGSPVGLSTATAPAQHWHQDVAGVNGTASEKESFGRSLATGDFGRGAGDDLAIGISGDNVGSAGRAGGVQVLYATDDGLAAAGDQLWNESSRGVPGEPVQYDSFGAALAAGNLGNGGRSDLAIGISHQKIGTAFGAGRVLVLFGTSDGLSVADLEVWDQGTRGVLERPEGSDLFGGSLSIANFGKTRGGDLAVGVENESVGDVGSAGAVAVFYSVAGGLSATGDQLWHQDKPGIPETAENLDSWGSDLP